MSGKASLSDGLSTQAAVGLPLLWAVVSGTVGGILALSVALALHKPSPWLYAFVTFGAVAAVGWLLGLSWWAGLVRSILGDDEPASTPSAYASDVYHVQVEHETDPAFLWVDNLEIPGDPDTITRAARMVAAGQPFTLACLGGRGKPMTRAQFESMRDYLAARGFAYRANNGPNSTTLLNRAGISLIRKIAERPLSDEQNNPLTSSIDAGVRIYSAGTDTHIRTQKTRAARRA